MHCTYMLSSTTSLLVPFPATHFCKMYTHIIWTLFLSMFYNLLAKGLGGTDGQDLSITDVEGLSGSGAA